MVCGYGQSFNPYVFHTILSLIIYFRAFLRAIYPPYVGDPVYAFGGMDVVRRGRPAIVCCGRTAILLSKVTLFRVFCGLYGKRLLSFTIIPISVVGDQFGAHVSSKRVFFLATGSLDAEGAGVSGGRTKGPATSFLSRLLCCAFVFLFYRCRFSGVPRVSPRFSTFCL